MTTATTIRVTVNGDPRRVAVERNLAIVPKSTLDEVPVAEADTFEIVHFVGGG